MAEQFNFKELDSNKRKEWLAKRPDYVTQFIATITNIRDTMIVEETGIVRWAAFDMDKLSPNIYYYLASCQSTMAIQNMIGGMASILNQYNNRDIATVWNSHQVASEIITALNGVFTVVTKTYNDKYVVRSLLRDPELEETLMYPLPLNEPGYTSRPLGAYNWTITQDEALNVLNGIPMTILQFPEPTPLAGTDQASKERQVKYEVRKALQPSFSGKRIFYNWHSDYRGRMSPGAYHFNPHGNEYEKSIVAFANSEKVTWAGTMEYRKALARAAGLDKVNDLAKLKWYNENSQNLHNVVWKEPHTARALMLAMAQIENTGSTNVPIELDATNSQLQVVSLLTGDLQTALSCNIVPDGDDIADAYGILAAIMQQRSGKIFTRNDVKMAYMVHGYGGGKEVVIEELIGAMDNDYDVAEVYEIFLKATEELSPASNRLRATFDNLWNPEWDLVTWELPDGFIAQYRPIETMALTLSPFGMKFECLASVNVKLDYSTALYVNVIHSVDAYIARQLVLRMNGKAWSIHDGFPTLGNNVSTMLQHYKDICGEIVESRLLEDIIEDITGAYIDTLPKQFGNAEVQTGNYAIS